ncbi:MAG: hypothetical protein HC853_07460 [Anaerolineae bacterium]|nr:hypothetical protein [Anaerolineae bacterium]
MITGKRCPRVTKWTFEVVKMQPPLQDFGYVKDPCVVQNAVDDFVRTLYFYPAYQTPESMKEVDKIYDTDPMNVKGVAEALRKSMIKQYREGRGIYHVCDKPLYLLLSVDGRSPLIADPTGRVTGRSLRITMLKATKDVEPFTCKFIAYKDGSTIRIFTLSQADLRKGAKFTSFQYDMLWNSQTKTWMVESHEAFQLDMYVALAKTLLAASPVKP